jgi:hypothetical protein
MAAATDTRIGKYLSITGMIHSTPACAVRRTKVGIRKGALITAEDAAYWTANGVTHKNCERCGN